MEKKHHQHHQQQNNHCPLFSLVAIKIKLNRFHDFWMNMGSFQKRNVPNFAKFPFVLWELASVVEQSGSTWCIQPSPSDLQIGKQAVGVCQREGRRHRGGLEGEGMRNKWRIVMQTEGISRDSFSLEAEILHLCQRAQGWQCLGAESYCSSPGILQGMLPALAGYQPWLLQEGDVCVWSGAFV